jgi:DNA-binding CsgD family transcriptional regulator
VIESVGGRVDVASAWIAEALALAEQIGEVWRLHEASVVQAEIEGLRGDVAACRKAAEGKTGAIERSFDVHLGRALLAAGEAEEAAPLLERAAAVVAAGTPRGWLRLVPLELAEAYVLAHRPADAERVLREVAPGVEACALLRPKAKLARVRGLLAAEARIDAAFGEAAALLEERPHHLERARVELNWGERLRRAGRARDAAVHLERAVTWFDALGCVGWAGRARGELEATGAVARRATERRTDALTPRELRIARHASAGLRDRDIAAVLYLSPRTVESHLQHAYRKLGVSNRTQLAAVLAADGVRPAAVEPIP